MKYRHRVARICSSIITAVAVLGSMLTPSAAADIPNIKASDYLTVNPELPGGVTPGTPRTLLLGDSTMSALWWTTGGEAGLEPLDYHLDAESCRTISVPSCTGRTNPNSGERYRAPNALTALASYPQGEFDELVLMVGYNEGSATFRNSVPLLLDLAKSQGIDHVTWLTFHVAGTYVPPRGEDVSYRSNNELLYEYAVASNGFLTLLDWDAFGDENPGTIMDDGAHLTSAGAVSLGYFITEAILSMWEPADTGGVAGLVRSQLEPVAAGFELVDSPRRVLDTRLGVGQIRARTLRARQSLRVDDLGLPSGATGALINLTAVQPAASGYLTVYSCTQVPPLASTLNVSKRQTRASFTLAAVDADAGLCVYSSVTTDVVVDLLGWATTDGSTTLVPKSPTRLYDTRTTKQILKSTIVRLVDLGELAGATGMVLNVTAVTPRTDGYVTVFPTDLAGTCSAPPEVSNLNFVAGETVPNRVDLRVSGRSAACIMSSADTHIVIDLIASYSAGGERWTALTPSRVLDSRTNGAPRRQSFEIPVGISGPVALTATAVGASGAVFVTVYEAEPDGTCQRPPLASTLNVNGPDARANSMVVVANYGVVCAQASAPVHLVVDLVGSSRQPF